MYSIRLKKEYNDKLPKKYYTSLGELHLLINAKPEAKITIKNKKRGLFSLFSVYLSK